MPVILLFRNYSATTAIITAIEAHDHKKLSENLYLLHIKGDPKIYLKTFNQYLQPGDSLFMLPVKGLGFVIGDPDMQSIIRWIAEKEQQDQIP